MTESSRKKSEDEDDKEAKLTSEEHAILERVVKGDLKEAEGPTDGEETEKLDGVVTPELEKMKKYFQENGYDITKEGELLYKDAELISKQRKVVFSLIKQIGSNILRGKSMMNVSMPVTIFDSTSLLERVALLYSYAPVYLGPLPGIADPIERMKMLIAFLIASMHLGLTQRKPFNPILGETLQRKIGDMDVFMEQTSHHPPIPNLLILGKNIKIYGPHQINAHTYPNSAKAKTIGTRTIEISGEHPGKLTFSNPEVEITGMMIGKRHLHYVGETLITDEVNKIYGVIRINPDKKGFFRGLFSKGPRVDSFRGYLTKNKDLLKNTSNTVFDSPDVISRCEGLWTESLIIDGKVYWEFGKIGLQKIEVPPYPLLSDSCFRADLQALQKKDETESQKLKEVMEDVQRKDRALREAWEKEQKKKQADAKKKKKK